MVVTGLANGAGWAGWAGVIDDLRINSSVYDLEPAQVTVTPASPIVLTTRNPQTVTFTLQASGWNSFAGTDETGAFPLPDVVGSEIQVGYQAVGATTVAGLAGVVPIATRLSQLTSPPPPVTFTLDLTAATIGSLATIPVSRVAPGTTVPGTAVHATVTPATTVLQLPAVLVAAPTVPATAPAVPTGPATLAATGASTPVERPPPRCRRRARRRGRAPPRGTAPSRPGTTATGADDAPLTLASSGHPVSPLLTARRASST